MDTTDKLGVTADEFEGYEQVRISGVTNMMNVKYVAELADISEDSVKFIITNYADCKARFGSDND